MAATLLPQQQLLVDKVMAAIRNQTGVNIFVDAPGGTGKTYTLNTILTILRSEGHIALAVASSGIASILLDGGRTFHSRFMPPWVPSEEGVLNIPAQSTLAKLIRRSALIVWDEAPMMHRFQLEAFDRTLRDLMSHENPANAELPFGNKTIILAGLLKAAFIKHKKLLAHYHELTTTSHYFSPFTSNL